MKKAGEHLKIAGNTFILLLVLSIASYIAISQSGTHAGTLNLIYVSSLIIYGVSLLIIGLELKAAGKKLMNGMSDIKQEPVTRNAPYETKKVDLSEPIVGQKIAVDNLILITKDLGKMDWEEAMKTAKSLGDEWRLPTKDELNLLFKNKAQIGGFSNSNYWSSNEENSKNAWRQSFASGDQKAGTKGFSLNVRAVRSK